MITTQLGLLSLFLVICFTVVGGILSGYPTYWLDAEPLNRANCNCPAKYDVICCMMERLYDGDAE